MLLHISFIIITVILVSKVLSFLFQKIGLPPVLSMIVIGLILGPTGFSLIHSTEEIMIFRLFSQFGVIILLFLAGLEIDIDELKTVGKNSFFIALGGVFVPFISGYFLTYFFTDNNAVSIVMGLILTATSVSVSVMTLMDMGKLKTVEGSTIVSSAIIDDIIGIIMLSIIFTLLGSSSNGSVFEIVRVIGFIVSYFILIFLVGIFIIPVLSKFVTFIKSEMFLLVFAFFIMMLFSWVAEEVQVAAITGAFFSGLFLGQTKHKHTIEEGTKTIGHTLFITIFFVFIGIQTNLRLVKPDMILYSVLFIVIAVISKIIGSGGIAKILGFSFKRSFIIGAGMLPRGEVALIIASLAMSDQKIITENEFISVILMVIVTSIITPLLLKISFKDS